MKKMIFLVGIFCVCAAVSYGQGVDAGKTDKSKGPRIEDVTENGHRVLKFFDKNGVKKNEIVLGVTETSVRLMKNRPYSPETFGLKISTTVAGLAEAERKKRGRDILVKHREERDAERNERGYVVVRNLKSDFVEYADKSSDSDSLSGEAVENNDSAIVYDKEGSELLKLDGYSQGISVSNTGKYFVVADDRNGRVINSKKETLLNIPIEYVNEYFSETDRFIIFIRRQGERVSVNVYAPREDKLELEKTVVDASVFRGIDTIRILEDERKIIIKHAWDIKTGKTKTDMVGF